MFDNVSSYDIKNYYLAFISSFNYDMLCRITAFSERHPVFFLWCKSDVTFEI